MNTLHILTAPNGKHLLIGNRADAVQMALPYGNTSEVLDSDTLQYDHYVSVQWLVENDIKKVIHI